MKGDRATVTTRDGQRLILVARGHGSSIKVDRDTETDRDGRGFVLIQEMNGARVPVAIRTIRVGTEVLAVIVQDRVGDDTEGKLKHTAKRRTRAQVEADRAAEG